MTGTPGTARFGILPDQTPDHTNSNAVSHLTLQKSGGNFTEYHFAYNPAQRSREMGTTRGSNPGHDNVYEEHQCNYMCNHDSFMGGNTTVMNMDERKVLHNTIYSIGCEWADPGTDETSPNGWAPAMTSGAFD